MTNETTTVVCPSCGGSREISVRQKRRYTSADSDPLCALCRTIAKPAEVSQEDKDFWTTQYSTEWISILAYEIWGDDDVTNSKK